MLIQGTASQKRTGFLVDKYCSLIDSGINAEEILVLVQNSLKKEFFINSVKSTLKTNHYENPQIHTFYGLCYNSVLNNWPMIENTINIGNPCITPHLCGLEISRFLFGNAIKEADFKDYNSKVNLLHQLFRRYSLISNNNLSDEQVNNRAELLNEVFHEDAQKTLNSYKSKTIQYRAFDYLRQLNMFNYLYKNTDSFKNIKYLILDDADEITPAEFDFIKNIKPNLTEWMIAYDRHGSSRLGFLNTDIKTVERLELLFSDDDTLELNEIVVPKVNIEHSSFVRRQEMMQKALLQVENLLDNGANPEDISIITPLSDSSVKFAFKDFFSAKNVDYQMISGNEKLSESILVKNSITLLKISLGTQEDIFLVRSLFSEILKIPLKHCLPIIEEFKKNGVIKYIDLGYDFYNQKLKCLIDVIEELKSSSLTLSEKLYILYDKLYSNKEISGIFEKDNYEKFAFFFKQIKDFEDVFDEYKFKISFQRTILSQIRNSIISENPSDSARIKEKSVVVATAQKIIDYSYHTKYQIWMDFTSKEWQHDDFGTLYNAWVFQSSWDKSDFTNDDNLMFSKIKTQKMLRKLALLAENSIFTYSCLYDGYGVENTGTARELLNEVCENKIDTVENQKTIEFSFVPREDQKPVFDYKGGNMAITAVPGAGKTTVLLALVIQLLSKGVEGENIFVLTYMDSAAKNFKDRIKAACPYLEKLPNISTIHGLALRILKENSNYVKVGLDENFEVCDDIQRQRLLRDVLISFSENTDDYDKYDKAISVFKLSCLSSKPYTKDVELLKFLKIHNAYNSTLRSKNLIDYDDMLLLSVRILEQNKDVAQYYQDICKYIIEDEAQDSSGIQQKLITILSSKYKNLIRCGDINQAITTTFTNTDLDGFRSFISNSKNVMMTQSQRCTKDVYELANSLVSYACVNDNYKNAFYNMKMQEVKGRNPVSQNAVISCVFDDYNEEKSFILQNIRSIFSKDKDASIAVLVRNNFQTEEYTKYFSNFGYKIVTGTETLDKQPVFNLLFSLIKFSAHPWLNETVIEFSKVLCEQYLLKLTDSDFEYLKNLKTPFILQNIDETDSAGLSQLLWDLNYWLENSALNVNIEDFSIKAGLYYYNTEIEKSNVYLVASFFKSLFSQYSNIDSFISRIEEIKSRPIAMKYKFFDEENEQTLCKMSGSIQIMTYHKSKGGEYDYVFIPALNEEYLQFNPNSIKIKLKERFLESVKALNSEYKKKSEQELKQFQIEENFRLLYVAVTRAKKKLFVTTSKNIKKYSKVKKVEPSIIFESLLNKKDKINAR